MPKEAKRLFLTLKVGEVSLVDEPANEKPIIVAKRKQEQEDMTTQALAQAQADEATETATDTQTDEDVTKTTDDVEVVQTDAEEGTPDAIVKALQSLVQNVADVATAKAAKAAAAVEKPKPKVPPFLKDMEAKLKAAGMPADEIKQAVTAAKAAFGASGLDAPEPTKTATTKTAADDAAPSSHDELVMDVLESIGKAKTFTPSRISKLVQIVSNLNSMLEELGVDKASFGASGITATGTSTTPKPPIQDTAGTGGSGKPANRIRKDSEGEDAAAEGVAAAVAKTLEPLITQMGELSGRLETIEKARTPSTQPGGSDGDGNEVSTKKNGSMWSGVL